MGSEGQTVVSIQDAYETTSLVRLIREEEVTRTIDRLLQQHGTAVMEPRSDGTSLLNSFALLGSYDAVNLLLNKGATMSVLEADGSTILHSVIRTTEPSQDQNRSKLLSLIIQSGNEVPVNHRNNKGWTALKLAAKKGLEQCVEVLLNHGADPNISDNEGYLPLHNAVGNKDIVKLLVTSTMDVNKQTQNGETPLYIAISHGNVACSQMLLEHGGNPNLSNNEGITPLFLASRSGNIPLVRALVKKKADPNQAGASQAIAPLHWAAHKEDAEIALLLIEHGADIQQKDKVGRTPLSLASQDLAAKMIEQAKLRNHPIEITTPTQMTNLSKAMTACCGGNVTALRALLSAGVNANQICDTNNNSTLLHMAAFCGQVTIVAMLLNNSADWNLTDKDGDTILHFSCMNNNPNGNYIATLQFLLSTPANALINAQNSRGDTPLLVAIRCKYVDRAKLLIQHNANVMITNNKREYPLHRACCSDANMEIILYLSDLVPNINTQDADGWTALMYAARSNCPAVLKYLLQRKADTNLQQASMYTALHLATQENHPEICRILLNHNANPNILGGDQNVAALHIAAHRGFKEICQLLAENGADYTLQDNDKDTPLSLTDDQEIKRIIKDSYKVVPSRTRSNSNPSPTNSPVDRRPALLETVNSKEEINVSEVSKLRAKLEEKEVICEILMQNLRQLKEDNLQYKTQIWTLEGDLSRRELAIRLASLPEDEKEFRQRWWIVGTSEFEKMETMLNDSSKSSLRFWNVNLGKFRTLDIAIKEVDEWKDSPDVRKCFFREVEQLSRLQCPQIVQFFGAFCEIETNHFGILIQYLPGGSLDDFIHKHKIQLEKMQKYRIIKDIILGMCYLHSFPILHRALKPANILLSEHLNAKISDFGFHETKKVIGYLEKMKSKCKTLEKCNFPVYTAPEVFERNEFSTASDVYSFGMVVYEMATYTKPFSSDDLPQTLCVLIMKIIMGARPQIPTTLHSHCQKYIASCWNSTPSLRPPFKTLVENVNTQIKLVQEEIDELHNENVKPDNS